MDKFKEGNFVIQSSTPSPIVAIAKKKYVFIKFWPLLYDKSN